MAGVPPKKGESFTLYTAVVSQADTDIFQVNPTIAAGDWKVSTDGTAFTATGTLPDVYPAAGRQIRILLSADEMNGDVITIIGSDQAGDEWCDVFIQLFTDTAQVGEVSTSVGNLNDLSAAQVNAEADTALSDYDPPTKAELDSGLAALNDPSAAEVWASPTRTLTQSAAQVAAAVEGSALAIRRGDTFTANLTGLGSIASRTKLWFTMKKVKADADADAIIQIEETEGLIYLNSDTPASGQGSITVTDEDAGDITIVIDELATAELMAGVRPYDVQVRIPPDTTTLTEANVTVSDDVTRAVT